MKSKEEILIEKPCFEYSTMENRYYEWSDILDAMEEYAQQQVKNLNIPAVMPSLPSQKEIDAQIDKYAFRVPYDGSNNFYDEVALKHYKAGIEWLLGRIRGNGVIADVMYCLLQEIEKLDTNDEHKDWYAATLQLILTEAKKQEGNLAVAILNALEDYLK